MTPEEETARGREAALVLENVVYKEAMIVLKAKLMQMFQETTHDQSDERDEVWRKMQMMDWLERQLDSVMKTGKMGEETLKLQNNQQ